MTNHDKAAASRLTGAEDAAQAPAWIGRQSGDPAQLLIVDDDRLLCNLYRANLEGQPFSLTFAHDGIEACALFARQQFDLVILDLKMPNMDGFAVLRCLRQDKRHKRVPVIVVSSDDDAVAVKRSMLNGATSMASKPLNWPVLINQLQFLLEAASIESNLRVERRKALAAARQRDTMLSLLTHELRTPLNAIIGFSELIEAEVSQAPEGGTIAGYAREVSRGAWRLSKSLNDAILFSKIISGSVDLEIRSIALFELLEDCMQRLANEAELRNVELISEFAAKEPMICCDKFLSTHAVMALIHNAVKFSAGGNKVVITARERDARFAVIEIIDQGIGMPQHVIQRFRQPFEQAENTFTRSVEGLGLGLTVADHVLQMHHGSLDLISELGRGTKVVIEWPLCPEDQ